MIKIFLKQAIIERYCIRILYRKQGIVSYNNATKAIQGFTGYIIFRLNEIGTGGM